MTNVDILTKAIEKAIAGGWDFPYKFNVLPQTPTVRIFLTEKRHHLSLEEIIYRHDFAKALWGEKETLETIGHKDGNSVFATIRIPKYQYHLQQMVVAEDPIKYIGEYS